MSSEVLEKFDIIVFKFDDYGKSSYIREDEKGSGVEDIEDKDNSYESDVDNTDEPKYLTSDHLPLAKSDSTSSKYYN